MVKSGIALSFERKKGERRGNTEKQMYGGAVLKRWRERWKVTPNGGTQYEGSAKEQGVASG